MLFFCKWKDEDGTQYGVCRKKPKAYFNWRNCHLCYPKYVAITAEQAKKCFKVRSTHSDIMLGVDIVDWNMYFDEIEPKLQRLFTI